MILIQKIIALIDEGVNINTVREMSGHAVKKQRTEIMFLTEVWKCRKRKVRIIP